MKLWMRIFYAVAALAAFFIGYHGILGFPDPGSHSGYDGFGMLIGSTGILLVLIGMGYSLFVSGWLKTNRHANLSVLIFFILVVGISLLSSILILNNLANDQFPPYYFFVVFAKNFVDLALFPLFGILLFVIWGIPAFLLASALISAMRMKFQKINK